MSWDYSSTAGRFLACLRSATRRLAASRLRIAEADGRVARRAGGGGLAASSRRSNAAAHAVARLRYCEREPADDAVIVGPATATTLSRTVAASPARSTSIVIVTAVSDVLAC
jgi:hypothetical protein